MIPIIKSNEGRIHAALGGRPPLMEGSKDRSCDRKQEGVTFRASAASFSMGGGGGGMKGAKLKLFIPNKPQCFALLMWESLICRASN